MSLWLKKLPLNRRGTENAEKKQSYFTSHLERANPVSFKYAESQGGIFVKDLLLFIYLVKTAPYSRWRSPACDCDRRL